MTLNNMTLKVLMPTTVLVEETANKIIAEAVNGYFCLRPRHIDFVAALVPGILTFYTPDDVEQFVAIDNGILVKCGQEVMVSTLNGVRGTALEQLRDTVAERFLELDEHERMARTALARLEAGTIRRFIELETTSGLSR
jgi:F-type H+-transporting ATPase subunit epsilon